MKKIYMMFMLTFGISIILFGCSIEKEKKKEDFGLEQIQKIEVSSSDDPQAVLYVIDNNEGITEFVNALAIDKWTTSDIPSDATKGRIYKMYQADTVKLGETGADGKELKQIATLMTYKDSPYIKLTTKKLNFTFEVPQNVEQYLSQSAQ